MKGSLCNRKDIIVISYEVVYQLVHMKGYYVIGSQYNTSQSTKHDQHQAPNLSDASPDGTSNNERGMGFGSFLFWF